MLNFMYDMSKFEHNMQNVRVEGVQTRSAKKNLMAIKRPKTEKFKKCLAYCGPKRWNALPEELQLAKSKGEFKTKLDAHMKQKAKLAPQ